MACTKQTSVSEDETPLNQRAPQILDGTSSEEEVEESTGSKSAGSEEEAEETGSEAGSEEKAEGTQISAENTVGLDEETVPVRPRPKDMFFPTTEYKNLAKNLLDSATTSGEGEVFGREVSVKFLD